MLADTSRRFDLYDLFSVLIPGLTLVIGLTIFLPAYIDFTSGRYLIPGLILGFVLGRGIHSVAVDFEAFLGTKTHRERFIEELQSPSLVDEKVAEHFWEECQDVFNGISSDFADLGENRDECENAYVLVRSYIHMDSRGRSRTFQAVYAFYRSVWLVSLILAGAFVAYGLINFLGLNQGLGYTSQVGTLSLNFGIIFLIGEFGSIASYHAFGKARNDYQEYYVHYLFADFLVLESADYPEAVVVAEDLK